MTDIEKISSDAVQDFIFSNEKTDFARLALSGKVVGGVSAQELAGQIRSRSKAAYKLPRWYQTKGIVYPPSLNLEQSSSEATARIKHDLVARWLPHRSAFVDLSAGFGVDSAFLSKAFDKGIAVDRDESLLAITKHNHRLLGINNISYLAADSSRVLTESQPPDLIYVDPSRRTSGNNRVFRLADCEPNVVELLPEWLQLSAHVVIKASPLLDIHVALSELGTCERLVIVSVDNDCKELLFFCSRGHTAEPTVECIHIRNDGSPYDPLFHFNLSEERDAKSVFSDPLTYLYEPNVSVMKSGAFRLIGSRFGLNKLHVNTHLYSSDQRVEGFPGRTFEILEVVKPDKKLREKFPSSQANILLRNYPSTVDELKKKTGLTEGGALYLIGLTGPKEKWLIVARRV